jgi:hypothetical protein
MIEAFGQSGRSVDRTALSLLAAPEAYPGLPAAEDWSVILRLLRFEALGPYYVWAVLRRGEHSVVRRIIWEQRKDQRPGVVEPTTFGSHAPVATELLGPQLLALQSIALRPFVPFAGIGIDGVNFGIECGSFWRSARLYWWCDPPPEWPGVQEWFDQTVRMFETLLPEHRA